MWNIISTRLRLWCFRFCSLCVSQHPDVVNLFAFVGLDAVLTRRPLTTHLGLTDRRRSVIIAHILSKMAVKVETSPSLYLLNPNMVYAVYA